MTIMGLYLSIYRIALIYIPWVNRIQDFDIYLYEYTTQFNYYLMQSHSTFKNSFR